MHCSCSFAIKLKKVEKQRDFVGAVDEIALVKLFTVNFKISHCPNLQVLYLDITVMRNPPSDVTNNRILEHPVWVEDNRNKPRKQTRTMISPVEG